MQLAMKRDAGSNKKRDTRQRGRYTRNEEENIRMLLAADREVDAAAQRCGYGNEEKDVWQLLMWQL